jgi:hypothetical protein
MYEISITSQLCAILKNILLQYGVKSAFEGPLCLFFITLKRSLFGYNPGTIL